MLPNIITDRLYIKKTLLVFLFFLTIISTSLGLYLDSPYEKYDRIFIIKKKFYFTEKFENNLSEGNLNYDRARSLNFFSGNFSKLQSAKNICRIDMFINSNMIEFTFLSFPEANLENCFKKEKKKLISAYLDYTLNYKEILRLNRIFNDSEEIENISEEEIVNFYKYHLNKNKYFFENFNFDKDLINEKKEPKQLINVFKNTLFFLILPFWIFIISRFLKHVSILKSLN